MLTACLEQKRGLDALFEKDVISISSHDSDDDSDDDSDSGKTMNVNSSDGRPKKKPRHVSIVATG